MDKTAIRGFPENPKYVAEQIRDIIDVMIGKMSLEARQKAYPNLKGKLNQLNVHEMSTKKTVGGSSIGASISLVKNILNGKDPYFIKMVIDELERTL